MDLKELFTRVLGELCIDLGDAVGGNTTHLTPPHTGIQKKAAIELGDPGTGRV